MSLTSSTLPNFPPAIDFKQASIAHVSASSVSKRLLDVLGSLIGLGILAIIFLPIALLIKLDSPGSIFYVQQRHGLLGKPFFIYKFRSMVVNADEIKSQVTNEAEGLIFQE